MAATRTHTNSRLTRYHRVNLSLGLLILTFAVTTAAEEVVRAHLGQPLDVRKYGEAALLAAAAAVFIVLYLFPDGKVVRRVQIAEVFVLATLYKLLVTPLDIGWVLLFVVGLSLMYRYGMLDQAAWVKFLAVLLLVLAITIAATVIYEGATVYLGINQLAIGVASMFLAYYLFEHDFLKARQARDRLQEESEVNRPFVAFGRHAAGVVHDLKNDVNLVTAYSTLLSMKAKDEEPLTEEDAQRLSQYVDRIKGRVDLVRYASVSGSHALEHINIRRVCHAAAYIFEIRPEYRRTIEFQLLVEDDTLHVYGRRAGLLSVLENLIGNACEAMVDGEGNRVTRPCRLTIAAVGLNGSVLITVADTGPGIPGCRDCDADNCLDCGVFRLGETTKPDGSGLGLFTVKNQVDQLGGTFQLYCPEGGGTVAQVRLPRSSKVDLSSPKGLSVSS
ncbi:MAG: sensor histidine kinase [Alkalispirochaetaceae bacterium]